MTDESTRTLAARVRAVLADLPDDALPVTYADLAERLDLTPPGTIRRVAAALEQTMREDAAHGVPFVAALVVSRAGGGQPGQGYFELAVELGRCPPDPAAQCEAFLEEQRRARAHHRA